MVIIMPEDYRQFSKLQQAMKTNQDFSSTIFDDVRNRLEDQEYSGEVQEITITMPSFKIDSGIGVEQYLKRVSTTLHITFKG